MQYLVLLSNCEHSKKLMLPRIVSLCVKYGHNEIEQLNGVCSIATSLNNRVSFQTNCIPIDNIETSISSI